MEGNIDHVKYIFSQSYDQGRSDLDLFVKIVGILGGKIYYTKTPICVWPSTKGEDT